ncbi:MAG: LytTR family transcriptional regulator DNA-binding domain-containing protein [Reichenbachiella sp.]
MSKIKALIIDDEHLAREIIKSYLNQDENIELIGECSDGFEGFKLINNLKPDIVFLDVMMPKLTGFEMLELLENPPVIIFSTAYDEYALKAFEKNAIDYLLKPYSSDRFNEALSKAKEKIGSSKNVQNDIKIIVEEKHELLSRVAVKTGSKIQIIPIAKIKYLEAMDDYVSIHAEDGKFLKQMTMKYFENHLPTEDFMRIHRSYIVKLKEIARLELLGKDSHVAILHDGKQLSVSRSGYSKLKEALGF